MDLNMGGLRSTDYRRAPSSKIKLLEVERVMCAMHLIKAKVMRPI